jgi:hypothetical protein
MPRPRSGIFLQKGAFLQEGPFHSNSGPLGLWHGLDDDCEHAPADVCQCPGRFPFHALQGPAGGMTLTLRHAPFSGGKRSRRDLNHQFLVFLVRSIAFLCVLSMTCL